MAPSRRCPSMSRSSPRIVPGSASCSRKRAMPKACRSAPASRMRRWRASRPTASAFRASRSRRACSASTRTATSPRMCSDISAASTPATRRSSPNWGWPPTTAAPTSSAGPGWRRAISRSCTARPASSRSRSTPPGAASGRWRARRRRLATTSPSRWISSCSRSPRSPSARAVAQWWRSSPPPAACSHSSPSRASTPTCSSMALIHRAGAS